MAEKEVKPEKIDIPQVAVTPSNINKNLLILGAVLSFIAFVMIFYNIYIYNQYTKLIKDLTDQSLQEKSQDQVEQKTSNLANPVDKQDEVISEGITNSQQNQEETGTDSKFAYKVVVVDKKSENFDAITESVSLLKEKLGGEANLFVDDLALYNAPGNKRTLYLLSPKKVNIGTVYENDLSSVSFLSQNQTLVPYLLDRKYCKTDNDCSGRTNFCAIGAYNKYHSFQVWGCGGPSFESIERIITSEQKDYIKNCPQNGGTYAPYYTASIDKASCVNSQCEPTKVSVTCN